MKNKKEKKFMSEIYERLANFFYCFRRGWKEHYPICCILQWCFEVTLLKEKEIKRKGNGFGFIPCSFHKFLETRNQR